MQIINAEVIPIELPLQKPAVLANQPSIESVRVIFIRLETQDGYNAWGCSLPGEGQPGDSYDEVLQACTVGVDMAPDLHPTDLEYSLTTLSGKIGQIPEALCAFDLAFHDLLGLAAGMPLYRLLGGYRKSVLISATIPVSDVTESVERSRERAAQGFRMLKIKGGCDPETDVRRVRAIKRTLPDLVLRLDADGGYRIEEALDVARILEGKIEILEQPTPFDDFEALRSVTSQSPVPVLADQIVRGPDSALELAAGKCADGLSVKIAACGGIRCARQVDAIARAARIATMVNCTIEPALMIAAGLSFALSSPNVLYSDLDGHLEVLDDPTQPGFQLSEGCLSASEMPGLGCTVELK